MAVFFRQFDDHEPIGRRRTVSNPTKSICREYHRTPKRTYSHRAMCVYVCVWWEWLGRYSVGLYVVRVYGGRESFVNPHPRPIRSLIKPEKSVRPIKRGTVIRQNGRQRNLGRWSTFGSTVNVANGERFGDARPSVIAKPVFGNVGTRVPPNLGGSCPDSCRRHELQARFLPGRTREFGGNDPRTAERWPSGALVRRHRSRCDGRGATEAITVKKVA